MAQGSYVICCYCLRLPIRLNIQYRSLSSLERELDTEAHCNDYETVIVEDEISTQNNGINVGMISFIDMSMMYMMYV